MKQHHLAWYHISCHKIIIYFNNVINIVDIWFDWIFHSPSGILVWWSLFFMFYNHIFPEIHYTIFTLQIHWFWFQLHLAKIHCVYIFSVCSSLVLEFNHILPKFLVRIFLPVTMLVHWYWFHSSWLEPRLCFWLHCHFGCLLIIALAIGLSTLWSIVYLSFNSICHFVYFSLPGIIQSV